MSMFGSEFPSSWPDPTAPWVGWSKPSARARRRARAALGRLTDRQRAAKIADDMVERPNASNVLNVRAHIIDLNLPEGWLVVEAAPARIVINGPRFGGSLTDHPIVGTVEFVEATTRDCVDPGWMMSLRQPGDWSKSVNGFDNIRYASVALVSWIEQLDSARALVPERPRPNLTGT